MLNLEKVKLMTKLSMYENTEGKIHLPISKYYRSDYIGLALIKNFFIITIGYFLLVGAGVAYYSEYLLNNIHKMNLVSLGTMLIVGYAVLLVFYSLLTYVQYAVRYRRAKKSVKDYYVNLSRLAKTYEREERRSGNRNGGKRK
ncbi:MAG: hypothetical protein ACOYBE_00095 [Blautia sp.]|jgi:uncharacterized membrane protein YesL